MSGAQLLSWPRIAIGAGIGLALLAAGVGIGFWMARAPATDSAGATGEAGEVLYWYDPMYPDQHFDKPGKSPFMDMQLVPRHTSEPEVKPGVRIDPGTIQNLGVRFAVVKKTVVADTVTATGTVGFNERDVAVVQAKLGGFVERSYRRVVGDIVRAGDPLVDLRVPEWSAALAEYLALRKGADSALGNAARQRLAMLGVPASIVADAESAGVAPSAFAVRSPIAGAVTALNVREGMTVERGAPVASINGLSPVWLTVSVPQGSSGQIKLGARAVTRLTAMPGKEFVGRVEAILPAISGQSRTVEVRISLPNPDGSLRPGMSGGVSLSDPTQRGVMTVPSEAVIRTGTRTVVITVLDDGRFAPVEVEIGSAGGDRTEIASGLSEGQRVVASGQFLIDSEANLAGVIARLQRGSAAEAKTYTAKGHVTATSAIGVTIAHTPVADLNWPAMTMQFAWGPADPKSIAAGDEVTFTFRKGSAGYIIETIRRGGQQ